MIAILTRRPTRRVWAAALLAASVLATPLAPRAHAAFGACRSDPLVTLSNGVTLRLYADIATDASQVQQVAYALHGPVGTSVVSAVIPADDPLWDKKQFVYYADGHDTKYHNQLQVTIAGSGTTKTKITSYIDGADDHGNRKTWQHGGDSTQVGSVRFQYTTYWSLIPSPHGPQNSCWFATQAPHIRLKRASDCCHSPHGG